MHKVVGGTTNQSVPAKPAVARWEMWQEDWGLDQRNGFSDDV